jgi:dienelactone hydrolase
MIAELSSAAINSARTPCTLWSVYESLVAIPAHHPDSKIGVIGLCLTGTWLLTLARYSQVYALAICQPAVPIWFKTDHRRRALGLAPEGLAPGVQRIQAERIPVIAFRFQKDSLSTDERLESIRTLLGPNVPYVKDTICSNEYPRELPANAHSVFVGQYLNKDGLSILRRSGSCIVGHFN